jgi:hypothetical protein
VTFYIKKSEKGGEGERKKDEGEGTARGKVGD